MKIPTTLLSALLGGQLLATQPNVIVIVSDDAGYADFGFMNQVTGNTTDIYTPELDALRAQGSLFSTAYTGAVCSPSRGAILSGSYQQRVGYSYNIGNNLDPNDGPDGFANEDVTAFERMKVAGYKTLAIGKWHVGAQADTLSGGVVVTPGNRPPRQGVDHFFGLLSGSRDYDVPMDDFAPSDYEYGQRMLREMSPGATPNAPAIESNEEIKGKWSGDVTDALGQRAREYVTAHANQSRPFFLYLAFTAPHTPMYNSSDYGLLNNSSHPNYSNFVGMSTVRKQYCSMMYTMDKNIGLLMDHLEDPNNDGNTSDSVADNTLIIFINDNGGPNKNQSVNLPLRGNKGDAHDGGCRVPMLMVGPGIPAGSTFSKPVHSMDLLPTMLGAGGNAIPSELMGVNLLPYVSGADASDPHEYVCVAGNKGLGLRMDDWKLVISTNGTRSLYNTSTDRGESNDIKSGNPAKFDELVKAATNFEVQMDKPNFPPKTEPNKELNYNYRFTLNPANSTTSGGADLVLIDYNDGIGGNGAHDSAVRNGGFETNSGGDFSQVAEWVNLYNDSGAQGYNAVKNNNPSPVGGFNAIISDVNPPTKDWGIDTGHFLTSGETFQVSYDWLDLGANWAADDRVRVQFFTTASNSLTDSNRTIVHTEDSSTSTNDAYVTENFSFSYSGAGGKKLFMRFFGLSGDGNYNGFARVDNVFVGRQGSGSGVASPQSWSTTNLWKDPSSNNDTLLETDSCALGTLVFPARSGYDYIARNDLDGVYGLEFIQNTLRFEGSGSGGKKATVSGADIVLAENFSTGKAPTLEFMGNGSNYTFEVAMDVLLYHDAVIQGTGTANHLISGELKDYDGPASLDKWGTCKVTLATDATYTGTTTITNGILETNPGVSLAGSPEVIVQGAGILGGNGTVVGDVSGSGTIAPGQSIGTLNLAGDAEAGILRIEINASSADRLNVGGNLNLAVMDLAFDQLATPVQTAYVIASYGSRSGTFASVAGLPAGYSLDYSYNVGGSSNHIALVQGGGGDTTPPSPNPAGFASAPAAISSSAVTMTALTGSDASGPVEYLFTETSGNPGGSSSNWQSSPTYTNSGLNPATQYSYTVRMRDSVGNAGNASNAVSVTTQSAPGGSLVVNGGFESGLANWGGWNTPTIVGDAYQGGSAVRLVDKGSVNQFVSVNPLTTYTLSAYAKTSDPTKRVVLGVNDGNGVGIESTDIYSTTYTRHEVIFTTGPGVTQVKIYCWLPPSDGESAFVDEMKLVEGGTPSDAPKLVRTTITGVSSNTWTTVDLGKTYNSPVVVATPIYPDNTTPSVVTRIRNVTSTGFELKLGRADGQSGALTMDVAVVAVDEGVYTLADDGVKMEAAKFTSTLTGRKGNWFGNARSYQNNYSNPVVVGQVMSHNDVDWSAFWSFGPSFLDPANASNLSLGKHVAEDSDTTRADEIIGYIVIESGNGSIEGIAYEAGLGADTVQGAGNSATPYLYSLSGSLSSAGGAAVSISAMDGNNGAWGVLAGNPAFTTSSLGLYALEDQENDSERTHTTTQMSYIVFE